MTALAAPRSRTAARRRVARLERPLLLAGLALVTAHLLDLSLAGPDTTALGVAAILAAPLAWAFAQPRVTRATRVALGVVFGLVAVGFGVVSHGLHAVTAGPDWIDVTGLGFLAGGVALVASAAAAAAAPRGQPKGPRALRGLVWVLGAVALAELVALPVAEGVLITHAPRWPIAESQLHVAHREVHIGGLSAWYVPDRNGVGVLMVHGSGGSRARIADRVEMLARHGYGVLALDLPGNGESHGRSNGLGGNAQPAVRAALDYLAARSGRVAGFGVSLGAEVLIEATAHDPRVRVLVADGATRPQDAERHGPEGVLAGVGLQAIRAVSGTRLPPSLMGLMPRLAPRPVLLVAGGGFPEEIPANRAYRAAGGPTVQLWERPGAGHTAGLRVGGAEYERRTVGFLDQLVSSPQRSRVMR